MFRLLCSVTLCLCAVSFAEEKPKATDTAQFTITLVVPEKPKENLVYETTEVHKDNFDKYLVIEAK